MDATFTGAQIAQRRKALELTQKELAQRLHVTDKAVSKWERGINFPDLGLIEALAKELDTTPAELLGLKDAVQDEVVATMAEISAEQLEDARRDLAWLGWGSIVVGLLLIFIYNLIPRHTVQAYQTLHCVIIAVFLTALYLLIKYEQIKKFDIPELAIFYGGLTAGAVYLGIQLFTGHSPHPVFGMLLICAACGCVQLLFFRIMKPQVVKALPMVLTSGFFLWHWICGNLRIGNLLPAIVCTVVWVICFHGDRSGRKPAPKRFTTILCVALVILLVVFFLFYPSLVRGYVRVFHTQLEHHAQEILNGAPSDPYGLWSVWDYPEQGMVQYMTGGSGLAPGSVYEGFYYSADDTHTPFMGLEMDMEIQGDTAYWRAPDPNSDNWGKSIRILENWYWFEAHF